MPRRLSVKTKIWLNNDNNEFILSILTQAFSHQKNNYAVKNSGCTCINKKHCHHK